MTQTPGQTPHDPSERQTDPPSKPPFGGGWPGIHLKRRWSIWRKLAFVALFGLFLCLTGVGAAALVIVHFERNLPSFESLKDYAPPQTTHIHGADGSLVGELFKERRTVVPYGQIPQVMINAITSAEDANFFEHAGVDWVGTMKALAWDLIPGTHKRGGSTLTQQTVKTMLLTSERTWSRKIKEMILAQRLEKNLTKEQILYIYLNQINFGHARYGIEEASQYYFGHGVKDLTLGEAALLAAAPKWPNEINPRTNPRRAKERQAYVLRRMVENKFIPEAVAEREIAKPLPMPPPETPAFGASYIEEVRRQLVKQFGEQPVEEGGLQVDLMMNPVLQQAAESAVRQGLREVDKRQGWRGPLGHIDDEPWGKLKEASVLRLKQAEALGRSSFGDSPLLDLRRVDVDSLEVDTPGDVNRVATWVKRAPGAEVVARVAQISKTSATIDFGTNQETIPLTSVGWARKFNPTSMTATPKSMSDVMQPGDLVLVRVVKEIPCEKESCEHLSDIALEQDPLVEGAFVAIDPKSRGVVALVGGYGFNAGSNAFERATQAKRQPGSAFKPFVYATALEVGQDRAQFLRITPPSSVKAECLLFQPRLQVNDAPVVIVDHWTGKAWSPHNFERDAFEGSMTMRHALATSKNTVAVKLIEQIGCDPSEPLSFADQQTAGLAHVKNTAWRAGIDTEIPDSITAALGSGEVSPIELVNAYTTFAAEGRYAAPIFIQAVRGPHGEVLYEHKMSYEQPAPTTAGLPPGPPTRGLRPDVAFVTANMMRAVVEDPEGTAHSLEKLGRPIAGKTGTANEHRDAWFVGFTPEIVAGAWVGFDDHSMLGGHETGGHAAGPIWLSFMKVAEEKLPMGEFTPPSGVVTVDIDPRSGLLADPHSPYLEHETFLAGTEPTQLSQPTQVKPEDYWREGP